MPSDVYIRFDGLEGDSKDHLNEKWIEVDAVAFQFAMSTTDERSASGAATTGRVHAYEVTFTKTMDSITSLVPDTSWRGTHVSKS